VLPSTTAPACGIAVAEAAVPARRRQQSKARAQRPHGWRQGLFGRLRDRRAIAASRS
jgi:hypothetical protein